MRTWLPGNNRPPKGNTSIKTAWVLFKQNKRTFFEFLLIFFNRFPNSTYPTGESNYWKNLDKYGQEEIFSPHNLWRGICHIAGGILLGVIAPYWLVTALFIVKEGVDVYQQGKLLKKNVFDVLCWSLGAIISNYFF